MLRCLSGLRWQQVTLEERAAREARGNGERQAAGGSRRIWRRNRPKQRKREEREEREEQSRSRGIPLFQEFLTCTGRLRNPFPQYLVKALFVLQGYAEQQPRRRMAR